MRTLAQDARYAARMLLRAPGFTLVALLTLALGIGANTAIFTIVNGLLLRPLPYADPDRLVMVWQDFRARGGPEDEWATAGNYADWRQETRLFARLAAIAGWRPTLTGGGEAESLSGEQVTHEYFEVLGVAPALGRTFRQADDVPGAPRVAVIGDDLWKRRFGGDPLAVGRAVTLSGEAHEIIGVLPPRTRPIVNPAAEIWRPLRLNTTNPSRGSIVLRVVARLPEGVTPAQAGEAAGLLAKRLEAAYPESNGRTGITITPLLERVVGDVRPGLLALLGAVAFVLLIACANIANLLLARGSARSRELAVRVALGAGRGRVLRQLLTESVLLALLGGTAGMLLGIWAVDALVAAAPSNAPRVDEIALDLRVLGFAAGLTLLTGILFGLAPALQASRGEVGASLKEGGRGQTGTGGRALRRTLVVAEVALALVLLTGAGLLLQTLVRLQSADLGFEPDGVLVGFVSPPQTAYPRPEQFRAFYDRVLERASAIPGIQTAALASVLPLSGDSDTNFVIEGRPVSSVPGEEPVTWYREVSATYFDAMGIRIVRGRGFDAREAAPSVVVNEALVRRFFPGEEALGRRMRFGGADQQWFTIIGVVADARVRGAREEARIETFVPYWQFSGRGTNVILKSATGGNPAALAEPMRQAVRAVDRNVPVANVTTLSEMVGASIAQPRVFAILAAAFAALAVLLAAIGLYGVMAYAVAQRIPEIGVRMALGAAPREVFRLVVGDGLWLTGLGILLGVGGSLLVTRWLTTMLFGVAPWDPLTIGATSLGLLAVAALACLVPARRATQVDPMVALRAE